MYFQQLTTPGLGCFSYVVGCPMKGLMAVVDPRRDIGVYLDIAERNGMRITHIFETHVHADHVSGARELAAATKADIYIHESAPIGYAAKKVKNNDVFELGKAVLRVLHTPGHTPNSISLLVSDLARSPEPALILTGDLLFVGDTGRPDLPGEEILDEQVENLYTSLYKTLAPLPDYVEVYPAHGQGSLCGRGMSAKPNSTLGYERKANPMLQFKDFQEFKQAILSHLPMRPQSFSYMIASNMQGAPLIPCCDSEKTALSPKEVAGLQQSGALILDLRDALSYGAAHIPGSINVDWSNETALNWVGMAVPPNSPLVLILPAQGTFDELRTQLRRIGYDTVKGFLKGGMQTWLTAGNDAQTLPQLSATALKKRLAQPNPPAVIDVRSPDEFAGAKVPGSINLPFGQILAATACPFKADQETVVVCQSGYRSGIAASLLQARGCAEVSVLAGGLFAWGKE